MSRKEASIPMTEKSGAPDGSNLCGLETRAPRPCSAPAILWVLAAALSLAGCELGQAPDPGPDLSGAAGMQLIYDAAEDAAAGADQQGGNTDNISYAVRWGENTTALIHAADLIATRAGL